MFVSSWRIDSGLGFLDVPGFLLGFSHTRRLPGFLKQAGWPFEWTSRHLGGNLPTVATAEPRLELGWWPEALGGVSAPRMARLPYAIEVLRGLIMRMRLNGAACSLYVQSCAKRPRMLKYDANPINRLLSVAPMLDWTDRYCRYFLRQITRHTLLYTEMITTGALIHGDTARFLDYHPDEHPLALQLGGSVPDELAACARLGDAWGYDEINLNVGCPSDRVQSGRFGACLMAEPTLVAECVAAMAEATQRPVTVKHRIGIDERDSYDELQAFVDTVAAAGCQVFIVHARKAWLQGLSPKQNREIPPLQYEVVQRLKRDFPQHSFVVNGGFKTLGQVERQLESLDGVMIGREAYQNPWLLAAADQRIFGATTKPPSRQTIVERMLPFIDRQRANGVPIHRITRHMLGLFQGQPGARAWRRHLSQQAHTTNADVDVVIAALALVT